jgi:Fe-S oxidoreductase
MKEKEPKGLFGGEQIEARPLEPKQCAETPHRAKDLALLGMEAGVKPKPDDLIRELDKALRRSRSLSLYLDMCAKCGSCVEACHWYLGTKDINNIPTKRADLLRKIYKRHFTWGGKLFPWFTAATDITPDTIDLLFKYFHQCNECRRCAYYCPFGIDTAEMAIAARQMLTNLGIVSKAILTVAENMHRYGNNMGIPPKAMKDTCRFMEEELKERRGIHIPIPVDQEGAEVLHCPSSSEFFVTLDTLEGTATMFYAAGTSWTLSSRIIETANFGLFFNHETMKAHNNLLISEARRLKVKRIVAGECGHGWRTWKMFTSQLSKAEDIPIVHLIDECLRYMKEKRIKLDRSATPGPVTLQDPCNMARACGYIEQPREVLRAVVGEFREMYPHGVKNFCCTGGSGQVAMDEFTDMKVKAGLVKAQQIKATGAKMVVAPCAICKAAIPLVLENYKLDVKSHGLQDLVGFAIVL